MPMLFHRSNIVFLHVHKTGGTWINDAATASGIKWSMIGYAHLDYAATQEVLPGKRYFTVLRNPYRWYASLWAFRHFQTGPGGDLAICQHVEPALAEFIARVTKDTPGYLTELYGRYAAPDVQVIKNIKLAKDLCSYLLIAGESFDTKKFINHPRINTSASDLLYKPACIYNAYMADMVATSEQRLFEQYRWDLDSWRE